MKITLIILFGFIISTGCSQSIKIVKGYAYERSIISGVKPIQGVSEDGTIAQKSSNNSGKQYLIYVSTKDTGNLQLKEVWIKGERYSAEAELVNERPVILPENINAANRSDTLFTSFQHKVWKVTIGGLLSIDNSVAKPQNLNNDELLIGYLSKQKLLYFSISKIIQIQPIPLQ